MRVLLIAASLAATLAMPVASSAQSRGLDYGIDVIPATGSVTVQGTGIVIPLPCPPTGECVNPWADQKLTDVYGWTEPFAGSQEYLGFGQFENPAVRSGVLAVGTYLGT